MKFQRGSLSGIFASFSLLALACLTACGGGSSTTTGGNGGGGGGGGGGGQQTTKYVAVYDSNCRVMIFDTPLTSDMNASVEIGQADFTHACNSAGVTAQNILGSNFGGGVVFDSSGNLYVGDTANNRVLQFVSPLSNGMDATLVFGQSNFTSSSISTAATGMIYPIGVALDATGDLWVADSANGRVLEFKPPFSSGMAASIAIGSTSTGSAGVVCNSPSDATNSDLCIPFSLAFDSNGNLWAADSGYNRVLEFTPPFSTGMPAALELGHAAGATAFTAGQANDGGSVSASVLNNPAEIRFDAHGDLWVSDSSNNRILQFAAPFSNGMAATLVLGQSGFTQASSSPIAQSSLHAPVGVAFDTSGNLLVADQANNRLLVFAPPFSSGMNATTVIGSANFTSAGTGTASQNTLDLPLGVTTF